MLHVFVETNWVVDYAAPVHYRAPAAVRLLDRTRAGELRLHLPSICLSEARRPILTKHQSRHTDTVRQFLKWAKPRGLVNTEDGLATGRVLDLLEQQVRTDLSELDQTLVNLAQDRALDVFPLDGSMLERVASLSFEKLDLHPFDHAVLAAVLVRAEMLRSEGETEVVFCELDSDLQPWDRQRRRKDPLAALYDAAGVWVYGDFVLKAPERPAGWAGAVP